MTSQTRSVIAWHQSTCRRTYRNRRWTMLAIQAAATAVAAFAILHIFAA